MLRKCLALDLLETGLPTLQVLHARLGRSATDMDLQLYHEAADVLRAFQTGVS
jgi:hypothetical protein